MITRTATQPSAWERRIPQLLVAPALVIVALTQLAPAVVALYESFRNVVYFQDLGPVGVANYAAIFSDAQFWTSLRISLIYTVACVALGLTLALVSALAIRSLGPSGTTLATLLLVPWAISPIVVALLARWILAPHEGGLFNATLAIFGIDPVGLLNQEASALPTLILISVWRNFAFAAIILIAGLARIPQDLYSAAAADGATAWERFVTITLPLLRPSLIIALVILTISYFNEVQLIIGLTNGGPARSTETLAYFLYDLGVVKIQNGMANAVAVVMFVLNVALVALLVVISNRAAVRGVRAL